MVGVVVVGGGEEEIRKSIVGWEGKGKGEGNLKSRGSRRIEHGIQQNVIASL